MQYNVNNEWGNEHTSNNHANILFKLGVHPNIVSKSIKAWIKRSCKGYNLAGLQKKCHMWGNWSESLSKRNIFLYHNLKSIYFPTKNYNLWWLTIKLITLTTYSIFDFSLSFSFLFYSFSNVQFFSLIQCCQVILQLHHNLTYNASFFSPTWIQQKL